MAPGEGAVAPQAKGMTSDGPTAYMVAQGVIFLKRSEEPSAQRIFKCRRAVGTMICTTGRQWSGPAGGCWAEVDEARCPAEAGWVLVEGPGFGVSGPLLVTRKLGEDDDAYQDIRIRWCKDPPIFECVMPMHATIGDLVKAFCSQTGLSPKETIFTKGLPGKAPNGSGTRLPMDYTSPKDVLFNHMTIREANITDTLNLVYVGHFDEDYRPKV
mmetsp:Transcript_128579/g.359817  ORF Transcript_128579/g.359817 Transcript_128579/m.359817 type:complete len:213 (+) Transcript_128579:65-703(+)